MKASRLAQFFRDQQRRFCERLGIPLPHFSIWDPEIPESRVRDPKKRGLIATEMGPASELFCIDCHRPSGFASPETMEKVFYRCNDCVLTKGHPMGAVMLPGTGVL